MDDKTLHQEPAAAQAADTGDRVAAVDVLLDGIVEDLNTSMVDNSREIAEVDGLLGLDEPPAERTRANGVPRHARPA